MASFLKRVGGMYKALGGRSSILPNGKEEEE